jgi:hypothetical protein
VASESESFPETGLFGSNVLEEEVRRENLKKTWADGARYIHWVGLAFVASFLTSLFNALPPRFAEPTWQLNLITLMLNGGMGALLGALLISVAQLFNVGDRQVQNRALLVRTLASWVALGWLLLIPLQLFLGVRLINTQAGQEIAQIENLKGITRAVRNATTEQELRAAMAKVPNTPPLPSLTVPLEVAKANLLSQFQKNISTFENRQEQESSNRWQTWLKEALRNSLQCLVLATGFLAIGKNRSFRGVNADGSSSRGKRSRS